jgi:hypothetical protein
VGVQTNGSRGKEKRVDEHRVQSRLRKVHRLRFLLVSKVA